MALSKEIEVVSVYPCVIIGLPEDPS